MTKESAAKSGDQINIAIPWESNTHHTLRTSTMEGYVIAAITFYLFFIILHVFSLTYVQSPGDKEAFRPGESEVIFATPTESLP